MKCGMTEVFLGLFQDSTDAFLFGDVVIQLEYVTFGLFGALVFDLGPGAFSVLRLARRSANLAHVAVVAEVNNDDDGYGNNERPEASSANATDDKSCACRTGKVAN